MTNIKTGATSCCDIKSNNKVIAKRDERKALFIKFDGEKINYIGSDNLIAKCGDIWMCKLPSKTGSVQNGFRPVLIISNNKNNHHSTVLNIIPLTTKMNKRSLPCHVEIWDYKKYGLTAPSTIMVEQVTTVQKNNLLYKMGEITDLDMLMRICRAMEIQFPMLAY